MKKTLHLFLPFFLMVSTITLFGNEITLAEAERLVPTVIQRNAGPALKNARNLKVTERFTKKQKDGKANFHIFNLAPTGFVIIAGDDSYNAVLAFSDESNIDLSNKENYVGLYGTLSAHEARIEHIRAKSLKPSAAIQNEWKTLRSGNTTVSRRQGVVVAPLTTTRWNQGLYYNSECPANADTAESGPDGRTYCGCGPIAMAQLIKYHNSPVQGNGSNSYVDPIYGEQTADFCSTAYNWANMPDELTAPNPDVAKLIYHMGVSTFTYYSTDYTETYLSYMRDAFVNNFGFDQSANWFYDGNGDFNWVARNDLDRGRPLLLSGESVFGGAHTWVADGYGYFDASGGAGDTEYFHFNWGWGGYNNGWFLDTDESWYPREDQTDNAEIFYYFNRYVVQNLFPAPDGCQAPDNFYTTGAEGSNIYLNVYYPSGEQDISFRYRKLGTTEWTTTEPTSNFFQLASGLDQGSEYEYQARRRCCPSDWSPYSETQTFVTAGFVPCAPLAASGMTVDVLSDNTAYIYTAQPFGVVLNRFRYRPVGTTEWTTTDDAETHYRYTSGLAAGTEYEVQVSQLCSNGDFTQFSESFTFKTTGTATNGGSDNGSTDNENAETGGGTDEGENTGETNNGCSPANGQDMTTSSITDTYAYVYTTQPHGQVNNQFRYRPVGSSNWIFTDISSTYYRFLADLSAGTTYEFANRQECSAGVWSDYSSTAEFTTTGVAADGGNSDSGNTDDSSSDDDSSTDDGGESTDDGNADNGGETSNTDNEASADCDAVSVSGMFTSSIGNANAYVYTPQPIGAVQNQFRYRPVGFTEWAVTDISTLYYRYLSNLSAGTQYEFQSRQECAEGSWSAYSDSEFFTTTGGNTSTSRSNASIPKPLSRADLADINPAYSRQENPSITLFPNPVSTEIFLRAETSFEKGDRLSVIDRIGRVVKEIQLNEENSQVKFRVGELEAGIYLLRVQTGNGVQVKKFIKQ